MAGAVVNGGFDSLGSACGFHDGLMPAPIIELDGDAASLDILADVIPGVADAACPVVLVLPGRGPIVMPGDPLRGFRPEGDQGHGAGEGDLDIGRIVPLVRKDVHQPRGHGPVL